MRPTGQEDVEPIDTGSAGGPSMAGNQGETKGFFSLYIFCYCAYTMLFAVIEPLFLKCRILFERSALNDGVCSRQI
jgi:hypothetical protein